MNVQFTKSLQQVEKQYSYRCLHGALNWNLTGTSKFDVLFSIHSRSVFKWMKNELCQNKTNIYINNFFFNNYKTKPNTNQKFEKPWKKLSSDLDQADLYSHLLLCLLYKSGVISAVKEVLYITGEMQAPNSFQ